MVAAGVTNTGLFRASCSGCTVIWIDVVGTGNIWANGVDLTFEIDVTFADGAAQSLVVDTFDSSAALAPETA
jgi:hypothetical protein